MWRISNNYEWPYLRDQFSWIRDMEGVPQDPIHHAEGDVATHTRMVLEALQDDKAYLEANVQDQHILAAAALLHDVEKRSTTVHEEGGRITSAGHAKKGEYTTRRLLYTDIPTPFFTREAVCKLVRNHGLPLWIFEKPDPVKAAIKASLDVNTALLATLARADVNGRYCADKEDLLYRIDLFTELCREQNCYGQAYPFTDEHSRFFYFQKEEVSPAYQAYDDTRFEVVMLSALPGSGKDYYILQELRDWPVVSLDAIRRNMGIAATDKAGNGKVIQQAKEIARTFMRKRASFVWNATNITRQMRQQLIELFASYGARIKVVYLEVPYQVLQEQNRDRTYVVPADVIERMIHKLEVPDLTEAHRVEYVVT